MNKRGSIPILVAATMPVALLAGVFAVDAGRVWLARARLQTALDAAALVAARDIDSPNAVANAKAVLAANFNGGAPGKADPTWDNIDVVADGNSVTVKASVSVDSLLNGLLNIGHGYDTSGKNRFLPREISGASTAVRASTGLELALVFDITLSMTATDAGGGKTRIAAVRDAGLVLLETLYGDKPIPVGQPNTNKKWAENLFISVIPFNVSVNMGSENIRFLGPARANQVYRRSWTDSTPIWGGCVEMRPLSDRDANPQTAGLPLFFSPSTYDPTKKYDPTLKKRDPQPHCLAEAAYTDNRANNPSGAHNVCMGHNDWTAPPYVFTQRQNTLLKSMVTWSSHVAAGIDPWAVAHGPNMMCPSETHKVLPLTRDRATVEDRIRTLGNLRAMPFSAGTNIAPGLQAGWFTLSPNWRNDWPSTEPPLVATDPRPKRPALPYDYFLPERRKVLILLTDGDNTWLNARMFQGNDETLVRPESDSRREEGFYGAYGNLRDQLGATTLNQGVSKVNEESLKWCEAIRTRKPKNNPSDPKEPPGPEQITIFTISFSNGVGDAARTLLSNCASRRNDSTPYYWHAPDDAALRKIFETIGAELSNLRLTQ